ncbi:MAG: phage tail tube protein [Caulobacter sp.]|nr:phage tail tube protein [Caulobacter sp.]
MADTVIPASERGRAVLTRIGFESAPGTIAGAWQPVRFYDLTAGQERPLVKDDQLGVALANERDATARRQGLPGGQLRRVAPLNLSEIGWWLSLGMSRAAPTGAPSDYVHVFSSGAGPTDTATLLQKFATDDYQWDLGCALASFRLQAAKAETVARLDMTLIGLSDASDDAAPAGTVASAYAATESFSDWRWRVLLNDVLVGEALNIDLNVDFGVERVQGMSGDEWPTKHHFGEVMVNGNLNLYGRAAAIRALGDSGAAQKIELVATHPDDATNRLISFVLNAAQFSKPQRPVSGPGQMSAGFSFEASQGAALPALVVTLKNGVSTYTPA